MTSRLAKFIEKETKARRLYDEQQCGCGSSAFQELTDQEANLVDEAIRLYKLPFEIAENKREIIDLEEDEVYDLEEGLSNICDAVEADDGELLDRWMLVEDQETLYKLFIWC